MAIIHAGLTATEQVGVLDRLEQVIMYCNHCQKKVIIVGINPGAATRDGLDSLQRDAEKEGALILFNPPPFGPLTCPDCHSELGNSEGEE